MKYGRIALGVAMMALVASILFIQPGDSLSGEESSGRSQNGLTSQPAFEPGIVEVSDPVAPELTGPARDLPPYSPEPMLDREINPRQDPYGRTDPDRRIIGGPDPLLGLQENASGPTDSGFGTPIFNFDGQGYTFVTPPDTVGDVGVDHYIQMINGGGTGVAVYNKHTGSLMQSFALTGLGGCSTGKGDPIVLYDHAADRWFLSEIRPSDLQVNSLCIFISTTPDPLGTYNSYQFSTPDFPDYPKYAVWPDGYYATTNESSPSSYALDRTAMLAGNPATSQRFTAPDLSGFGFQTLTPGDWDGATAPPAGAPNYFMRHVDTEAHGPSGFPTEDFLEVWAFHVDWSTPTNSSFAQIANISVAEFDSDLCGFFSFSAIAMPDAAKCSPSSLDPLREVVMWRLQYRNFGSHENLVGNFVTDVSGDDDAGVRWFELRKSGAGAWSLYQEGTYAPDSDSRWMGAIAMDGAGNIALGYNVSSSSTYPSLRYAGRLTSDSLGTMPEGEHVLVDGSASNASNRYGDYAAMSVDPVDDCTFWFTGEYNVTNQWSTRIGAFKFDACGTPDFTLSAEPYTLEICVGTDAQYDVIIGSVSDYNDSVSLSASGNPAGTTASFSNNPVTPPGSSLLTVGNTGAVAAGSYNIEIFGLAPTSTHTTTVGLGVSSTSPGTIALQTPINGAINQPTRPTFTWSAASQGASYEIELATDSGFNDIVDSATVTALRYTPDADLNISTAYFWRVRSTNACGIGDFSAAYRFTTVGAPGDCGLGSEPVYYFEEDFEDPVTGWTSGGISNTWALSTTRSHSPVQSYHATDVPTVSDQQLVSPEIQLPVGENPLTLEFWNWQELEERPGGCFDGAILEITTDSGANWNQVPNSSLLTDPYDGPVSTTYSNPLGGLDAWCGDPPDWLESVVDLNAYTGETVQFRFRVGTDSSESREGWYIDDMVVQSCQSSIFPSYLPLVQNGA
ncbi:MAG: hypothetical protein WA996_04590 [Candidatus Promineifilaceae bacterium]